MNTSCLFSIAGIGIIPTVGAIAAQSVQPDPSQKDIPSNRPNIILILADDMGYGDLGCYGQP